MYFSNVSICGKSTLPRFQDTKLITEKIRDKYYLEKIVNKEKNFEKNYKVHPNFSNINME